MALTGQIAFQEGSGGDTKARQARRLPVRISAAFRRQGSGKAAAEVHDLSTNGFRIESFNSVVVGTFVWLTLPGLESACARVAWCEGDFAGCEFLQPLHPAVLDLVVRAATAH